MIVLRRSLAAAFRVRRLKVCRVLPRAAPYAWGVLAQGFECLVHNAFRVSPALAYIAAGEFLVDEYTSGRTIAAL